MQMAHKTNTTNLKPFLSQNVNLLKSEITSLCDQKISLLKSYQEQHIKNINIISQKMIHKSDQIKNKIEKRKKILELTIKKEIQKLYSKNLKEIFKIKNEYEIEMEQLNNKFKKNDEIIVSDILNKRNDTVDKISEMWNKESKKKEVKKLIKELYK